MDKIIVKARAKINLSLDILGKREDGYHNVKMLMQTVELHDSVLISKRDEGIKVKCNLQYVPTDNRNVVYKAAAFMIEEYKINSGIYINLRKNIPVSAGLGGGSADAAAVLEGINLLFELNLSKEQLMNIGSRFGSDIPYCLIGGTALAEGIGEKLTMLPSLPKSTVLICKPSTHISTSYVYSNFDLSKVRQHPDTEFLIKAIKEGDVKTLAGNMKNVLETVTAVERPIINDIKNVLIGNGAQGTVMSGSGTCVFGFFENRYKALQAANKLKRFSKEIFVTSTYNK